MANDKGLMLVPVGNLDKQIDSKKYDAAGDDLEARSGAKTGVGEDRDPNLSIIDSDAKVLLTEYYKSRFDKKVSILFKLRPVVDSKHGVKTHESYYFGQPMRERVLNIRNKTDKPVSWKPYGDLMKTIRWMDTFQSLLTALEDAHRSASDIEAPASNDELKIINNVNANLETIREVIFSNASDIKQQSLDLYDYDENLQKIHDAAEAAFQEYREAQTRLDAIKAAGLTRRNNSALKAARAALKATKAVYSIKSKKYIELVREKQEEERERAADAFKAQRQSGLKGRGLRGAGVAPLDGVVRRGRTYNLNEIQGLATPSTYVYRQIGSKYIRLPDLDAKTLVIVQPNCRKCGPKCSISDSLQAMIKTLVYKKHIDQAAYDKLSINDRKMFKEILSITHLQYQFHDKLDDPLDSLRAEYDKLKGEMDLGNDNPSIIKQLKSLSTDMYSNRLISDSEFRDIITRLI